MPRRLSSANAPKRSASNVRRTIGANIKARRLALDWNHQDLADRFGVSRSAVSQYKIGTGEVNAGDLPRLPRLPRILGVDLLGFYCHPARGGADPGDILNDSIPNSQGGSKLCVLDESEPASWAATSSRCPNSSRACRPWIVARPSRRVGAERGSEREVAHVTDVRKDIPVVTRAPRTTLEAPREPCRDCDPPDVPASRRPAASPPSPGLS